MTIRVNTRFHPFRLNMSRKEPVQLCLEVENASEEAKMLTLELIMSRELSLDKAGIHSSSVKRIDSLAPHAKETFYYDIHPKLMTHPGEQPLQVKVLHHYNEYKFVEKEQLFPFTLRVEE